MRGHAATGQNRYTHISTMAILPIYFTDGQSGAEFPAPAVRTTYLSRRNFYMKTYLNVVLAGVLALGALSASAEEAKLQSVANLYKNKAALSGKEVRVQGKVVKVNEGIMKRNFLHVQDGSGDQDSNDLTVTSQQTAKVGDQVLITGKVLLNKDFGYGYNYPLLLEATSVTVKK